MLLPSLSPLQIRKLPALILPPTQPHSDPKGAFPADLAPPTLCGPTAVESCAFPTAGDCSPVLPSLGAARSHCSPPSLLPCPPAGLSKSCPAPSETPSCTHTSCMLTLMYPHTVHPCSYTHVHTHTTVRSCTSLFTSGLSEEESGLLDGQMVGQSPLCPCALTPAPWPPPWPRAAPTHRHGLAAMQGVDGRLGLCVRGKLHEGTACPKKRRCGEGQQGLSGWAEATRERLGSLDGQSVSHTGNQKGRRSDRRASQPLVQTDSWTVKGPTSTHNQWVIHAIRKPARAVCQTHSQRNSQEGR